MTALEATPLETAVRLAWLHPTDDGATSFLVFRSAAGDAGFKQIATTSDHTYLDAGLKPERYFYFVKAVHGTPPVEFFAPDIVAAQPTDDPPPPPIQLALQFSYNLYELTWSYPDPPRDLAGFWVEERHGQNDPWRRVHASLMPPDARSFLGGKPKHRTFLRVVAADRSGHLTASTGEVAATPGDFARERAHSHHTPTNLTGTGGETVVDLAWVQPENISRIYRSPTSGAEYTLVAEISGVYGYLDAGVPAGTWYYVVTSIAHDPPEESPYSNEVSVVVTDVPPPAPTDSAVVNSTETYTFSASVANPPPDFVGFNVYGSASPGGPETRLNASLILNSFGSLSFQDRIPRGALYLRASSVDTAGHETLSAEQVAVEPALLIHQEPRRNATFLGGGGSVSPTGEFVWHGG